MSWFPNTLSKSFLSDPPIFAWLSLFSYRVLSSLFFSLSLSLSLSLSPPPSHTQKSASQPPATGGLQVAVQSGGIACSASTLALFYQRACSLHRSLNLYSLTARPRRCLFFSLFSLLSLLSSFSGFPSRSFPPQNPRTSWVSVRMCGFLHSEKYGCSTLVLPPLLLMRRETNTMRFLHKKKRSGTDRTQKPSLSNFLFLVSRFWERDKFRR